METEEEKANGLPARAAGAVAESVAVGLRMAEERVWQ